MSINHIGPLNAELDANFKSLKINNTLVSLPVKDNYYYTGTFDVQSVRYLQPWSGIGTSGGGVLNQLAPLRNIKITNILARKQNSSPDTDFTLSIADLNLNNPIDLYTISVNSGQFYKNETVNLTINSDRTLFVRTQSTGSGNPQDCQVTILYEQV
jgi:hypothetical protein